MTYTHIVFLVMVGIVRPMDAKTYRCVGVWLDRTI
jgi:hypothetical protein